MTVKTNVIKLAEDIRLAEHLVLRCNPSEFTQHQSFESKVEKSQRVVVYGKGALPELQLKNTDVFPNGFGVFEPFFADFLDGPFIESIDFSGFNGRSGSRIIITIHPDFPAKAVFVHVDHADGMELASGPAKQGLFPTDWIFSWVGKSPALSADRITVWAINLPDKEPVPGNFEN